MSFENILRVIQLLLAAMVTSLQIFGLTLLFALPLGLLICWGRMSKIKPIAWLFRIYISIMRGTPLMLQLFVVYFGPYYIFGITLNRLGNNWTFVSVIIGFVVNYAAYFAEIYRSGISSMPIGQYEAAKTLGYSKSQTFVRIILPQVIRRIIPTVTNEVITLVKDTSIAFAIGVVEMFTKTKQLAASFTSLMPYVVAGVLYYVFNFVVAELMEKAEKKLGYYKIK